MKTDTKSITLDGHTLVFNQRLFTEHNLGALPASASTLATYHSIKSDLIGECNDYLYVRDGSTVWVGLIREFRDALERELDRSAQVKRMVLDTGHASLNLNLTTLPNELKRYLTRRWSVANLSIAASFLLIIASVTTLFVNNRLNEAELNDARAELESTLLARRPELGRIVNLERQLQMITAQPRRDNRLTERLAALYETKTNDVRLTHIRVTGNDARISIEANSPEALRELAQALTFGELTNIETRPDLSTATLTWSVSQ